MNQIMGDFTGQVTNNFTINYQNKTKEAYFTPTDYPALCTNPGQFDPDTRGLSQTFDHDGFAFSLIYFEGIGAEDDVDMTGFVGTVKDIVKELVSSTKLNQKYNFGVSVQFPKKKRFDNEDFKATITIKGEVI